MSEMIGQITVDTRVSLIDQRSANPSLFPTINSLRLQITHTPKFFGDSNEMKIIKLATSRTRGGIQLIRK